MNEPGWKHIPTGGVIAEPGTARKYETGGWRTFTPKVDMDTCTNCLQCWIFCPDSSIFVKDKKLEGIDYAHCKGCGICAKVCPVNCIEMVKE